MSLPSWFMKFFGINQLTDHIRACKIPFWTFLMVWDRNRRTLLSKVSPQMLFLEHKWFPPAYSPQSFAEWRSGNIYRICDMSKKGRLLSKDEIEQKFQVHLPWFQYHQVHHMFNTLFCLDAVLNKEPTLFELRLDASTTQVKGLVSMMYKSLNAVRWAIPSSFQN